MTIANLNDVLKGPHAIAGLVVLGWEDAKAFVEAAEETGIPIVLQAGPGCRKNMAVAVLGKMFRHLAERASLPIVCHIDHAYTYDECLEGIDCGFTSVMFDGSKLPINENIALTAKIAELAHRHNISVEGEVGMVGYTNGNVSALTSVEEAHAFDQHSGADALAISIGNVHLNTKKTNGIDFARLVEIESATKLPLVLHGGSGIPISVRQKLSRESRVKKFNIGTELRMVFGQALRQNLNSNPEIFDRIQILNSTIPALKEATKKIITDFR